MKLWAEVLRCGYALRSGCTRHRTFLWLLITMMAWLARPDLLGVTSFVRASGLAPPHYHSLLNLFHSSAVVLPLLLQAWVRLCLTLFAPVTVDGYVVFAGDGLKVPKEGHKMPGVKLLYQESTDNAKAEYIMGHSFQAISLLVTARTGQVLAVPLWACICEGVRWSWGRRRRSLLDKLASMFLVVTGFALLPAVLVADAYYASRKVIEPLRARGHHLIARCRRNTVAYEPAPVPPIRKRGRPKKYGRKVHVRDYFKGWQAFTEAPSPVYGEQDITIQYRAVNLLWRPVGQLVRFVLVKHPVRGKLILLATALTMDPLTVIKLYGLRFKIEVSFKQALHTIGTYAYHFWMRSMIPIKWGSGNQYVHTRSQEYQRAIQRKLDAYHRYVQIACIVHGLLQHLAINFRQTVWASFKTWLRTMKPHLVPSEMVVAHALRSQLPHFLLDSSSEPELKKFLLDRADYERLPGFKMVV